jgi:predicted 3-demethylubiquinone-9 3-methyltransferase (glyoxalase superfamily)
MNPITPFLWFNSEAEEAARYYVSIFPNARLGTVQRFPAGARGPEGSVMLASFELAGQEIVALNGNRKHPFSPASSLLFSCDSKEQAEELTEKLATGGERQPGGWLVDRYGVSWQIALRRA